MAFTGTNPVVVGYATQKSHFDAVFDNTIYLRDNYDPDVLASTATGNQTALPIGSSVNGIWLNWAGASSLVVQGIPAGTPGQMLVISNMGTTAGRTITLSHENGSASAANRLYADWNTSKNVVLRRGQSAALVYSVAGASGRWVVVAVRQDVEFEYDNGNLGTTPTIDFAANGPIQKGTRNGNATITVTPPPFPGTCILKLVHDATANVYTVAFSPSVKWPNGSAFAFTNTANAIDILTMYWDGSTMFVVGQAAFA